MLLRTTLRYSPAVVLPRAAAFILVVALTHILPTAEFGLYALVVVVGEIVETASTGWIRMTLLRLDGSHPTSWRSAVRRSTTLTCLAGGAGALTAAYVAWSLVPDRPFEFATSVIAYAAATSAMRLALTILRMQERSSVFSLFEGLRAVGIVAAAAVGIAIAQDSFMVVSIATSTATALAALGALVTAYRGLPAGDTASPTVRERLVFGAPIMLLLMVGYCITSSDRILLKTLATTSLVGIYAAALTIGRQPIDVVSNAIVQGSYPELIKRYDALGVSGASVFATEMFEFNVLCTLPIVAVMAGMAKTIVGMLLPPAYHEIGTVLLPFTAAAGFFFNIKSYVFDNVLLVVKKNWLLLSVNIASGAIVICSAAVLIPQWGALGAAAGVCLGTAVGAAIALAVIQRFIPVAVATRRDMLIYVSCVGLAISLRAISYLLAGRPLPLIALCQLCLVGTVALILGSTVSRARRLTVSQQNSAV